MPATPRRATNFGGSSQHQRLMMANLAASLFAAEGIVTTEAKAKALRPIAEKLITKAKKAQDGPMRVHRIRQIQGYLGDREMTHKLVNDVAPRYEERNGGYTRILKLGFRLGDGGETGILELVKTGEAKEADLKERAERAAKRAERRSQRAAEQAEALAEAQGIPPEALEEAKEEEEKDDKK